MIGCVFLNGNKMFVLDTKGKDALVVFPGEYIVCIIAHDYAVDKNKKISWFEYEKEFSRIMEGRNIKNYIIKNYSNKDSICLLCSEALPNQCHRRLVAEIFGEVFEDVQIIHL